MPPSLTVHFEPILKTKSPKLTEEEIQQRVASIEQSIRSNAYNFASVTKRTFTQKTSGIKKRRYIYSFQPGSDEYYICEYLKERLNKAFNISYPNRDRIIRKFFDILPSLKDINDFTIVKFDFKDFFESITSKAIFDKHIKDSSLLWRNEKDILEILCSQIKRCHAGIQTSNALVELSSQHFDQKLKSTLFKYGLIYYERYVDDVLIVLSHHISETEVKKHINLSIEEAFPKCNVKCNSQKYLYVSRRLIANTIAANTPYSCEFSFLGYYFVLNCAVKVNQKQPKIEILVGISKSKREKFEARAKRLFQKYEKDALNPTVCPRKNLELLRQRIKAMSCRVVYKISRTRFNASSRSSKWISKGIVSAYSELRNRDNLEPKTERFLKNVYNDLLRSISTQVRIPYFFSTGRNGVSAYNLFSCLERNRTMLLVDKIGSNINSIVTEIQKIDPTYCGDNKTYSEIVLDYLEKLKMP